jgi:hypothetical protein
MNDLIKVAPVVEGELIVDPVEYPITVEQIQSFLARTMNQPISTRIRFYNDAIFEKYSYIYFDDENGWQFYHGHDEKFMPWSWVDDIEEIYRDCEIALILEYNDGWVFHDLDGGRNKQLVFGDV